MLTNKGSHFISKGDGSCGLNVHSTGAHLVEYVEGWGPLWAWSTFGFGDMNGTIMDLTHGTGNVCRQGPIRRILYLSLKAGLHATICRPDLSARQCRSANRTCILTPDLRPIRENENRPDSENLLQCNRFLCSRADTFKEADMSIKILSREHAFKSEAIKMADKKTP